MQINPKAIAAITAVAGLGAGIGATTSALSKPDNRDAITKFAGIATAVGTVATGALLFAANRSGEGAIAYGALAGLGAMLAFGAGGAALGALAVEKSTT